jgi:hypothetical protein
MTTTTVSPESVRHIDIQIHDAVHHRIDSGDVPFTAEQVDRLKSAMHAAAEEWFDAHNPGARLYSRVGEVVIPADGRSSEFRTDGLWDAVGTAQEEAYDAIVEESAH